MAEMAEEQLRRGDAMSSLQRGRSHRLLAERDRRAGNEHGGLMTIEELAEKSLPKVNELLRSTAAAGAYCLGLVCALAWRDEIEPPATLLDMAAKCPSPEQAVELYREFVALRAYVCGHCGATVENPEQHSCRPITPEKRP